MVLMVGFAYSVPLFAFGYLMFQSRSGLRTSLITAACAWGFFHTLFERILHLQFDAGLIQTWLGL